jgi:hypothetical protein
MPVKAPPLSRRSFLKVMAIFTGAAAAPASTFLVDPVIAAAPALPVGAVQVGLMREVFGYDIGRDEMLVRYDTFCADKQLQCSYDRVYRKTDDLDMVRAEAKTALEVVMRNRGVSWSDLTPLPIPSGMKGGYV